MIQHNSKQNQYLAGFELYDSASDYISWRAWNYPLIKRKISFKSLRNYIQRIKKASVFLYESNLPIYRNYYNLKKSANYIIQNDFPLVSSFPFVVFLILKSILVLPKLDQFSSLQLSNSILLSNEMNHGLLYNWTRN